jgi:hypothetical protein
MNVPINPETKVGALLEAYPELEEVLIRMAPAFSKLRNPVLRKTVAKVATLEQAARIGGVSVRSLVQQLREAVGQQGPELNETQEPVPEPAPAWVSQATVRLRLDADELLARGEHPLGRVREAIEQLAPAEVVELSSSFRPEPLIEALCRAGFLVFSRETAPGRHVTYFRRPESG